MLATIYAIGSALFFALTFLFRKQASRFLPSSIELLVETIIATIILILLSPFLAKKDFSFNRQGVMFAIIAGIFLVGGLILNFLALKYDAISKVIAIASPSQIIFGILLGVLLFRENLTIIQGIGIVLSIAGIFMVTR